MSEPTLTLFVPEPDAAVCCDCGGVFLATGRTTCPGCLSTVFIPVKQIGVKRPKLALVPQQTNLEEEA